MPFPPYTPTMPEVLRDATARFGDREMIVCGNERYTFAQADREAARLAKGLLAAGAGKGTRIGILMPNDASWVLSFLAVTRIGAIAIPISTLYQPRELNWVIPFADIHTLLVTREYLNHDYVTRIESALPGLKEQKSPELLLPEAPYLRAIIVWGDCDRPWAKPGPESLHALADATPQIDDDFLRAVEDQVVPADLMLMIYTSGSTAEPKGVVHTHGTVIRHTHVLDEQFSFEPGDRLLPQMPFFWLGGLNFNLFPILYNGTALVLPQSNDAGDILALVLKERCSHILGWPNQMNGLKLHPNYVESDFSFMKPSGLGLNPPRDEEGNLIKPGLMSGGLGMTESFGPHSRGRGEILPPEKRGAWGLSMEGIDRKIVHPETGEELPVGEEGELLIRGYALMSGMYKKEREDVFTADGFYPTGDRCSIDEDGYLFFDGRWGEMLKVKGANVAPLEVELVLHSLPDVQEAGVFGMEDGMGGDRLVAVVIPAKGTSPTEDSLRATLKEQISSYKIPGKIIFHKFEDLPRTGSNKLHKIEMKKLLLAGELEGL